MYTTHTHTHLRSHSVPFLRFPGDGEPPTSTQVQQSSHCARVRYSPSPQQQLSAAPKGLNADFIIHYDSEHKDLMGDIQVLF